VITRCGGETGVGKTSLSGIDSTCCMLEIAGVRDGGPACGYAAQRADPPNPQRGGAGAWRGGSCEAEPRTRCRGRHRQHRQHSATDATDGIDSTDGTTDGTDDVDTATGAEEAQQWTPS